MATATRSTAPPSRRGGRDPLGSWLRTAGVLCLFAAVGVAASMGWFLFGTGFATDRTQESLRRDLDARIAEAREGENRSGGAVSVPGRGIAVLRIPRMKLDMVLVEGTDPESLKKGPGHYPETAYPWERRGRVGIAGHRTTYRQPFWALDTLRRGDEIRLDTEYGAFSYRVTGLRVVSPDALWVLRETKAATLVLTTCHPKFSAAQRLVAFATRVKATGSGPRLEVSPPRAARGSVGPGDGVERTLAVSVAGSLGAGVLYLVVGAAVHRRRPLG